MRSEVKCVGAEVMTQIEWTTPNIWRKDIGSDKAKRALRTVLQTFRQDLVHPAPNPISWLSDVQASSWGRRNFVAWAHAKRGDMVNHKWIGRGFYIVTAGLLKQPAYNSGKKEGKRHKPREWAMVMCANFAWVFRITGPNLNPASLHDI